MWNQHMDMHASLCKCEDIRCKVFVCFIDFWSNSPSGCKNELNSTGGGTNSDDRFTPPPNADLLISLLFCCQGDVLATLSGPNGAFEKIPEHPAHPLAAFVVIMWPFDRVYLPRPQWRKKMEAWNGFYTASACSHGRWLTAVFLKIKVL